MCGLSFNLSAQKYITKNGKTHFNASTGTFEPIKASNNTTTALLDVNTGNVAALVFVKAFKFKLALMEEHFNENYMLSDEYPKATFKGRIKDFEKLNQSNVTKEFDVLGVLNIKGVYKSVEFKANIQYSENRYFVKGEIELSPKDFKIKIPSIVQKKIANTLTIKLNYELHEKI